MTIRFWATIGKHVILGLPLASGKFLPEAVFQIRVALFDGGVRMVNNSIGPLTWAQACTPGDGVVLGQPNNDRN
jgi:hypothetical protein